MIFMKKDFKPSTQTQILQAKFSIKKIAMFVLYFVLTRITYIFKFKLILVSLASNRIKHVDITIEYSIKSFE